MKSVFSKFRALFVPAANVKEKTKKNPMAEYIHIFGDQQRILLYYYLYFLICIFFALISIGIFMVMNWKNPAFDYAYKMIFLGFGSFIFFLCVHSVIIFRNFRDKNKNLFKKIEARLLNDLDRYSNILSYDERKTTKSYDRYLNPEKTEVSYVETHVESLGTSLCKSCGFELPEEGMETCPGCNAKLPKIVYH